MNGTRLGRGRGGRLAVYGGCGIVVILLVFLYRTATTEMTRLRDLNIQCSNQQEALAAQLQVIFEYKVRLEKSLAEEKNSNAAAKRELQERANREKSLRDKDSSEALSRYKSLQQQHKLLQTEVQDLRDECDKEQKRALEEANKLESTLQDLRSKLRKAQEEKEKALEHLKNKYIELETDKRKIDEKYSELLKNTGNTDSTVEHLRKEVFQLQRELEETKLSCKGKETNVDFTGSNLKKSVVEPSLKKPSGNSVPAVSSSQQPQQVSQPSNNMDNSPVPIQAPRSQQIVDSVENNPDEKDGENNVGFIQRNGIVMPAAAKDIRNYLRVLPPPYVLNDIDKNKKNNDNQVSGTIQKPMKSNNLDETNNNHGANDGVLPMPGPIRNNNSDNQKPSSTMQNKSEDLKAQSPDKSVPDENQRNLQNPLKLNK